MSSAIDEAQVRHIAKLSRLSLSDDEFRLFASQLGEILEYVQQLSGVDTHDVAPLAHPHEVTNVLREDEPAEGLSAAAALSNAPDRVQDFFRVPAILDGGGG